MIRLTIAALLLAAHTLCAQPDALLRTSGHLPAATFDRRSERVDLQPFTDIFVDTTALMPLSQVQERGEFVPLDSLHLAGKFEASKYTYWLHFRVKNPSADTLRPVFALMYIDSFSVYAGEKAVAMGGSGHLYCPDCWERPLPSRMGDDLLLLPGSEVEFWVKSRNRFNVNRSNFQAALYAPGRQLADFVRERAPYYLTHGLFFIFLATILCIALLQFWFNRERIYLYYTFYLTATGLFFWRSFEIGDPVIIGLRQWVEIHHYAFYTPLNLLVMFAYLLFIVQLIEARERYPDTWRLLRFGIAYLLVFLLIDRLLLWHDYRLAWRAGPYFRLPFMAYCVFILFRLFQLRANPMVRYVLIGSSLLFIFSLTNTLLGLSRFRAIGYWDISILSNQLGTLLEILYFFLAMGYRARWLDQENHRMETTLLWQEKEAAHLRQLDEAKHRFFTNFTHEFRTPLTLILGLTQEAESKGKPLETNDIKTVRRNGERILQLVNQILDLAKLDAGTLRLQEEPGDLMAELRYTVGSFESLAVMKNVRLSLEAGADALPAVFDSEKLRQVVSNLISNAVKFTHSGGEVAVKIQVLQSPQQINITVCDTGPGIPPEHLERVFDRFYQSEDDGKSVAGGTGIGLSIVKEFVELMGGTVSAQSVIGKGSTFKVELPLKKAEVSQFPEGSLRALPPLPNQDPTVLESSIATGQQSTVILVVEDHPDVARFIAQSLLFTGEGYDFRFAVNGKQGFDLALDLTPDLIISDVMMPEMDGYALARLLKNDLRTDHIPLVLLTARADHDSRLTGLRERADVYLTKPFEAEELRLQVANLLERQRVLRERFGQFPAEFSYSGGDLKSPPEYSPEAEFMARIHTFLQEKAFDAEYAVPRLCRDLGMSTSQLHRKLSAVAGQSPGELITTVRLERAAALLTANSQQSISEVAFDCGFNDPDYFSRVFSRRFGVPPGKWRASQKG